MNQGMRKRIMRRSLYGVLATLMLVGCSVNISPQTSEPAPSGEASTDESTTDEVIQGAQKDTTPPQSNGTSSASESVSEDIEAQSTTASLPFNDVEIVPGEKFAFVTSDTSRQDLVEVVGEGRLTDEEFHIGEGFMEPATAVDLGEHSFTVIWTDAERTDALEVRGIGPAWELPAGIHAGMSLDELQQALGDFQMFGLGWDYGGTLVLDNTTLDDYRNDLVLRMEPAADTAQTHSDDFLAVSGDRLYESTNPHFESFDMTLEDVVVYLETIQIQ
jgi:hypothetical protein